MGAGGTRSVPPTDGDGEAKVTMTEVDPELLRILVCPIARAPLVQSGDWLYSTDGQTRLKYPVRDGIPVMLVEESQVAEPAEFERVVEAARSNDSPTPSGPMEDA